MRPTELYRLYDVTGRLLYVGISYSAIARQAAHKAAQPWWQDVARIEIERLELDRTAALEHERDVIRLERPLHNIMHGSRPIPDWHRLAEELAAHYGPLDYPGELLQQLTGTNEPYTDAQRAFLKEVDAFTLR